MVLTSTSAPKVFGDWAYLAIEKHFQKTIKHESDVLNDKDPEALHQMRVGMRRLRTAVTSFAPAITLPKAARDQNIGKIARRLGELRDLDVLQDTLQNQYLPTLPKSEQKTFKKVLATLEKDRQDSLEKVHKTLKQERYLELKQAFKKWLEEPNYGAFAEFSIEDVLPDLLLPLVSELLLHPAWLVGVKLEAGEIEAKNDLDSKLVVELLNNQGDLLHSLRKQAKGVRYQMELFTDFYSSAYQNYVTDIKSIQQILGRIQDSFVLAEFLTDTLNTEIAVELPTLSTQLSSDRYEAWQEWRSLQQRYLNSQTRKNVHQTILTPILTEG
ncbi:MAG TPA: metal-binding protein [Cyanobacteria bacterium UBA12227]|nr:metal-binding protein [Cyanobacteria bacterium UBA12227]HAX87916.1 metal-binding protein [Cyanobacteria bacterium UBA11370]HBY80832.1 metal-binding protein [Cyanobacteria bacterium UBA11148]